VTPPHVCRHSHTHVVSMLRLKPVEELDPFGDPAQPNGLLLCKCGEQSTLLALGRQVEDPVNRKGARDVTWDANPQPDQVPGCAALPCRRVDLEQRVGVRTLTRT